MTTVVSSGTLSQTTEAGFRAWGARFSQMLADAGLVKTADTGQIDWATATLPGVNTISGYEVWQFTDALQATAPIFFKVEYGTGGNSSSLLVYLTVSTATNGAGNLSSPITKTTRTNVCRSGTPSSNTLTSRACFSNGSFWIQFHQGVIAFAIERARGADGTPNSDGFSVYMRDPNSDGNRCALQAVRTPSSSAPPSAHLNFCLVPTNATLNNASDGVEVQLFPHFALLGHQKLVQTNFLTYLLADITEGSEVPVTMFGTARTYIACGQNFSNPSTIATANGCMLAIWE